MSAYAPTLENAMKNPDETRIFNEQLSSLINSIEKNKVNVNANLLLSSVNFIIYSLQIPSLNINLVTKQDESHNYDK